MFAQAAASLSQIPHSNSAGALDAERSRTKAAFSDGDPSANYGLTYSNSGPDGDTFRDLELEEEGERENELLQDLLVDALSRRLVSGRIDEVNEKFDVIAVLLARDVYLPSGPAQAPVAKSAASSSSSATATSDLDFMESVLSSWQGRSRFLQDQIHQMMEVFWFADVRIARGVSRVRVAQIDSFVTVSRVRAFIG